MSVIQKLTPQMSTYNERFTEEDSIRWIPYLMFFNPRNFRSEPVNTDANGFRYSWGKGKQYSVTEHNGISNVRLLAGNSFVFSSGCNGDERNITSLMTDEDPKESYWLNFSGVAFNSAQELLMLVLYRHLLPKVEEIVLISGFNNLGLARMPAKLRGDQGAMFSGNEFYEAMYKKDESILSSLTSKVFGTKRRVKYTSETPSMTDQVLTYKEFPTVDDQIDFATKLTLQHLSIWRAIAADMGAKLTYMLQPFATWVRTPGSAEEQELFAELDMLGNFTESYGDILSPEVGSKYATKLRRGINEMNVNFIDLNPLMSKALRPDQWAYVDRIHLTDEGYSVLSKIILDVL